MPRNGYDDTLDIRFRLRAVHVGASLCLLCGLILGGFAAATLGEPRRVALLGAAGAAVTLGLVTERLPWPRIARSRMAEPAFVSWSAALIAILTTSAALDGGVGSPLTFALVLPIAYVATCYPTRSVLAVGAVTMLALGALITVSDAESRPDGAVLVALFVLGVALSVWQAHTHGSRQVELARASRTDPLTGVLNRHGLQERLRGEIAAAERTARAVALVQVDLQGFHTVNERRGYDAGDELLRWSATRLRELLRPSDALGRTGADEFTIVAPTAGLLDAEVIAARVTAALSERTSTAVGIASFPQNATTLQGVQAAADASLAQARTGEASGHGDLRWAGALARSIDLRLAVATDHSGGMGGLCAELGGRLGMRDDDLSDMRLAGALHDIGKTAVPDGLLNRAGALNDDELLLVRRRIREGADLVRQVPAMEQIADWIGASLERWDGTGYPDGLSGERIPLPARILHVADAFDALTHSRPYRASVSADEALRIIEQAAGAQFDPAVVEALRDVVVAGISR